MLLHPIDWTLIVLFFIVSGVIGLLVMRRAGSSTREFFTAGSRMPWWLLGVSMVATTFSTDTPNLVTDIVRTNGVAGNWAWWPFLLTGMLTVFVYARLWSRSKVLTDMEFYELRYSGKMAAVLRGFRAIYLGVFFNIVIMASVSLAAIKMGEVMFNLRPIQTILVASIVTVIYCSLGGLQGVLITDMLQFAMAMIGSVAAAYVVLQLPEVGGLSGLLAHENVADRLSLLPSFSDNELLLSVFIIPLAVQWWSVWYPGSEPGGGGYIAQRMLAAKDEQNAMGAALLFNVAHYALRPWPWIIVALCSLVVFPDTAALAERFPHISARLVQNDLGYPAMLTFLPAGLLGLVVASLIAAYMSTISTHLNWGASYVVNDCYQRFIRRNAEERELVLVGRITTAVLMVLAGTLALGMRNALDNFEILLQIGAGTGLLFILRWFWWRINAVSELAAMIVSFIVALYFRFFHGLTGLPEMAFWLQITVGVAITTVGWVVPTLLTRPTSHERLVSFYRLVRPGGPGWRVVVERARAEGEDLESGDAAWQVPIGILCMLIGCVAVYAATFATGYWIYGNYVSATILTVVSALAIYALMRLWHRVAGESPRA